MFKVFLKLVLFTILCPLLLSVASAQGKEPKALRLSEKSFTQPFIQVGNAKFSVLFWDIYHSKLYTPSGNYLVEDNSDKLAIERPLLFEIEYLKDISSKDLISRTVEQWQHLNIKKNTFATYLPQLKAIWPNITSGDSLALLIENNKSSFYFNDEFIGSIDKEDFGELFLAIWLSPNTSQPKLRKKLLGD